MWRSTDGKDKDQAQEPHQDIQDKRKDESSNPISHENYHPIWLEDGIFFCVSLGPRILILKSTGRKIIINSRWLLKDEEAIDWRGGFWSFHWAWGQAQGKVMEVYQGRGKSFGVGERKKEEKECVEKKKLILMCGKVLFMRDMCARIKHGRISMKKPLEFYFK